MNFDREHTWGHTIAFGEEYYQNGVKMLRALRKDAALIAEFAARCTEALRQGHKVYANATSGHMPVYELVNEREGNPALFEFCPGHCTPEQFAAMQKGDVLFTNHVSKAVRAARDAGVFVAVITTCYTNNRNAPAGMVQPNENDWMPEDAASCVIESHIPWEQGLVHAPAVPEMAIFPGSGIGSSAIHWMITAEACHALETDIPADGTVGGQYVDLLLERLAVFHERDRQRVDHIAPKIARRIIAGGRFFVRSRNQGVQSEVTAAQGMMLTNSCDPRPAPEGGDRDIFLIAAVGANDPKELEWADEARTNGNYLIGIGPSHNDGLRLRCDEYFDDCCAEDTGVIAVPGRDEKVCPATGILNLIIKHVLTAQFVDEMCRRGAVPYFYMGYYRQLGTDYNKVIRPIFERRGY